MPLQTVTDGLDHAVDGFLEMLQGGNIGKALIRLDTELPDLAVPAGRRGRPSGWT